jgi:hypothetical protein
MRQAKFLIACQASLMQLPRVSRFELELALARHMPGNNQRRFLMSNLVNGGCVSQGKDICRALDH